MKCHNCGFDNEKEKEREIVIVNGEYHRTFLEIEGHFTCWDSTFDERRGVSLYICPICGIVRTDEPCGRDYNEN